MIEPEDRKTSHKQISLNRLPRQQYLIWLAFFTAFAVTVYVVESAIPKPFPFMKLGLANIVILILLISGNFKSAFIIALSKTMIGGFFTGTLLSPTTLLSLSGSILSLGVMMLFIKLPANFSIIGISVIGATVHNLAQIGVVRLILIKENSIFYLTPLLIILGIVTGIITGYLAHLFLIRVPLHMNEIENNEV